jgi:hypothetical protein
MADEPNDIGLDELRVLIEKNTKAIENLRRMIEKLNRLLAKSDPSANPSHPSLQGKDKIE